MSLRGPIICVEDDEDDQYLIQYSLEELGVTNPIRFFVDGQAALEYLVAMNEQPFLILCDINMPRLNGLELRHQILESDYLRQKAVPFVFLTTAANKEMVQEAYNATVQGFYQKAHTVAGLKAQLRQIIEYWTSCLHPNSFDE